MVEVKVRFSRYFIINNLTRDEEETMVAASTLRSVVEALVDRYGERFEEFFKRYLGRLIFVNINGRSMYALGGLDAQLKKGDEVQIIAIQGIGGG